jgi:hypothetical protein
MVHGGERPSHSIAINDGYIEVHASRKGAQSIPASTKFVSNAKSNLYPEIRPTSRR